MFINLDFACGMLITGFFFFFFLQRLAQMARDLGKRYVGSTSSVTAVLSHFYFALSNNRPVDTSVLSQAFASQVWEKNRSRKVQAS